MPLFDDSIRTKLSSLQNLIVQHTWIAPSMQQHQAFWCKWSMPQWLTDCWAVTHETRSALRCEFGAEVSVSGLEVERESICHRIRPVIHDYSPSLFPLISRFIFTLQWRLSWRYWTQLPWRSAQPQPHIQVMMASIWCSPSGYVDFPLEKHWTLTHLWPLKERGVKTSVEGSFHGTSMTNNGFPCNI